MAVALAVLIRSEAIDFVVLLGVPVLIIVSVRWKIRVLLGLSFLATVALLLAPWLIRNEVQLGGAVLSTQQGLTLAGSYCNDTFDPASLNYGGYSGSCVLALTGTIVTLERPPDTRTGWTEARSGPRAVRAVRSTMPVSILGNCQASCWNGKPGHGGWVTTLMICRSQSRTVVTGQSNK